AFRFRRRGRRPRPQPGGAAGQPAPVSATVAVAALVHCIIKHLAAFAAVLLFVLLLLLLRHAPLSTLTDVKRKLLLETALAAAATIPSLLPPLRLRQHREEAAELGVVAPLEHPVCLVHNQVAEGFQPGQVGVRAGHLPETPRRGH
ncbi:unnamed protein product, partial [Ectocarpus sp. 12 AP-2014]